VVGNTLRGVPNGLRNGTEAVPYKCKMECNGVLERHASYQATPIQSGVGSVPITG